MRLEATEGLDLRRQSAMLELLADLPNDYPLRYQAVEKIRHAFQEQIAATLEQPLNDHVSHLPQETLVERKELATWINQQLRDIGLAIKCPPADQPGSLVVSTQDAAHPEISRFRFVCRMPDGRYSHHGAMRTLGYLELTEHARRVEPMARANRRRDSSDRGL